MESEEETMEALEEITRVEFPKLGWGPWEWDRYLVRDLFGNLSIAWYGVIICLGIILAGFVILKNAKKKEGFKTDSFLDYFLISIPLSVVGARLMYVLTSLKEYHSFADVFKVWEGGLAFYGGLIFGVIAVFVTSRVKKDPFFKVADAIIPGVILAQAIGRWGNFINGEAHGTKTDLPWGMMINEDGPFHPTFFYEILVTFSGFILLQFILYRKKKFDGELLCVYMTWYGVGRTFVEGLRTDSLPLGPLRISQVIGVASAVAGVVLFFLLYAGAKKAVPAEGSDIKTEETAEETKETAPSANEAALDDTDDDKRENAENGNDH